MASNVSTPLIPAPNSPEQPEAPTNLATLRISAGPAEIAVSGQGTTTQALTLGVIGPVLIIGVGHLVGFPPWPIVIICALQIIAAVLHRRRQ